MTEEEKPTLVPTSSMKFEKHVLILRAYVVLTDNGKSPVHYKTVMKMTRLARTQISGTNAFFVGLGLLRKVDEGIYNPVDQSVLFIGEKPGDEDFSVLKPVLQYSALYRFIKGLIRIHGTVTVDDAVSFLLEESGEKSPERAKRALEWLEKCGLMSTVDDEITLIDIKEGIGSV